MPELTLATGAAEDLAAIARYSDQTWGRRQAEKYRRYIEAHFVALLKNDTPENAVLSHRKEYRVSRCQHHYVFFVRENDGDVLVLAVLHQNMDLVSRFRERLERMGLSS